MEPREEKSMWQMGDEQHNTRLGGNLTEEQVRALTVVLTQNRDLFAWTVINMSRINPCAISQNLSIYRETRPLSQKKQLGEERRIATYRKHKIF